jgi:hypothetical protein
MKIADIGIFLRQYVIKIKTYLPVGIAKLMKNMLRVGKEK